MAGRRTRWSWVAVAVTAAVGVGALVAVLTSDGEDRGEPTGGPSPQITVGLESGVRFELITALCGYEVVVTADTTVDPRAGEFCLARLDVRNRGDIPQSFDPSCQYLFDTAGTRYRQREDVLPLDEVTMDFFEQELAPKTLADDVGLYYDVPKGTEADAVELHTSCDSPGVRLTVEA